jgi:hypothetical protein
MDQCIENEWMARKGGNSIQPNTNSLAYSRFKYFYENYLMVDLGHLYTIYHDRVEFKDPVHEITGLKGMQAYFKNNSKNLICCEFEFVDEVVNENSAHITWDMYFEHPKINHSKPVKVRGMSFIKFDDKIYYHEDVYDLGAMIYEHIPFMGKVTQWIKNRM